MKVAVLGVGLIGGSIGLAARRRMGAEVIGYDADPATASAALEGGAIDRAAGAARRGLRRRRGRLLRGAGRGLVELAGAALAASGPETVVTDAGSTKLEIVAALGDDERFVGGHPLAGAETAGVANAREELFEGARWYLTPTAVSSGVLYDRLQRTIAGLGARPQAIEAEAHDRLMATASHLPHVVANAVADEAAAELRRDSERLSDVGPSLRDATRVAGANPEIWGDIFASNRESLADAVDSVIARLQRASELIREGDGERLSEWQRGAAGARRALLESESPGGPLQELRLVVPNRPGIVAGLALALGDAGINIEDMALYPAQDTDRGDRALGGGRRARPSAPLPWYGRWATPSRWSRPAISRARFNPSGPLAGALRPPPDKSISHRAALIAALGEGPTAIEGFLDSADTRSTLHAVSALGAGLGASVESPSRLPRRFEIEGVGLRGAAPGATSTWATPAPCCDCCPAGWRVRRPGAGRSTETSRSGAGRWTGWPSRSG